MSACEKVAEKLNNRYRWDYPCFGMPAYVCAGIVMHTLEGDKVEEAITSPPPSSRAFCRKGDTQPWCPDAGVENRSTVSFSWLQKQSSPAYGYPIFPNASGTAGYIFKPGSIYSYLLCAYPVDGISFSRTDCGCGEWGPPACKSPFLARSTCLQDGIRSENDFFERYIGGQQGWDVTAMCSFGKSRRQFEALRATGALIANNANPQLNLNPYCNGVAPSRCAGWNELILKPWYFVPVRQIPIEAFFYVTGEDALYPNSETAKLAAINLSKQFPGRVPAVGLDIRLIYTDTGKGPFFCPKEGARPAVTKPKRRS